LPWEDANMKRVLCFIYGSVTYVFFLGTFLYLIGFIENLWVPKSVDTGEEGGFLSSLLINVGLIALFGVQHGVMARLSFKERWTRIIPEAIERSTFVLLTCLILSLMYWQWQPMTSLIWNVQNQTGMFLLYGISAIGWVIVLLSTFLINHFDLFGLRQVILYLLGKPYTPLKFKTIGLYKSVRHPLMLGFLIAFWVTPTMSVGHLLLATSFTIVIFISLRMEEGDLEKIHGEDYKEYKRTTSMILPLPKKTNSGSNLMTEAKTGI
jgi:methanethiol S-methyltransferase